MTSLAATQPETFQGLRSLRVLARLLDYPSAELQAAADELEAVLRAEARLPVPLRQRLGAWCRALADTPLLGLQASVRPSRGGGG